MSQEGSVIGNRLGISKNWTADFGNYGYKEKLNKTIFLREWMRRMIKRFSIWLLAMQIVKQKNTYNIHVLCLYFPDTIPLVHNVYFSLRKQPHWYWVPTMSGFFNAPFDPPEPTRMGDTVKNIACKFWKKNNVKIWTYRKIYLKVLENFLEEYLTETFKCSVNLKLYNLLDYYHVFGGNFMNAYISQIIKLFPGAQYKFNRKDLKTSLFYLCLGICRKNAALIARIIAYEGRRTKQWSVIIAFLFRIIAEVFYYVPGPGETILSKDFQRASCMRVKISGKKEGEMRALKQNYYFSNLQGKMVPTQTLSVDVDYSLAESRTVAGILGVKVWIY